jgi:uncharacterized surface protein with fasciclin (FAS1) repeats
MRLRGPKRRSRRFISLTFSSLPMYTHKVFSIGLLAAGMLLGSAQVSLAQTTTKVKDKPGKTTVVKQKTEDGDKTKIKSGDKMSTATAPATAGADQGVMVGGAMMLPARNIVDNAVLSKDHTTLVTAVKQAGLVETLKGTGPFTVFAPTNDAFDKLPAGTIDRLMMPESKDKLSSILTYHVVPGALRAADLQDGQTLTTVQGQVLTVMKAGPRVMIRDASGKTVSVSTADVISSNGVTHVVDGVLMPGM